jgi:hypothetical protein
LNKYENFAIIYIESERGENRIQVHGKEVSSLLSPGELGTENLKSFQKSSIIYIESEREK